MANGKAAPCFLDFVKGGGCLDAARLAREQL
jgi:hypothetical protein